jgi:hypothetical protein
MEMCSCPECGGPAVVEDHGSYDARPGDTVRVSCVSRHWFLGPRRLLVPLLAPRLNVPAHGG